jgi:DNA mismatch endonuclease (patch repair protein)
MADKITPEKRSLIMIKGVDTEPEKLIRSLLHKMGYRFRLHKKDLPGKPDIVLPKYKSVIFVHGCFWHQHKNCNRARIPEQNRTYWVEKFSRNTKRDDLVCKELVALGWQVLIIWECELKKGALAISGCNLDSYSLLIVFR